jgi:hypothetical protein
MRDEESQPQRSIVEAYSLPEPAYRASDAEVRPVVIAGIRALAQMLEDHPELPTPYSVTAQAGLTDDKLEWQEKRAFVVAAATALGAPIRTDCETQFAVEAKIVGHDVRYTVAACRPAPTVADPEPAGGAPDA